MSSRIYVDLETLAHLFQVQSAREEKHRESYYREKPELKEKVRLEVDSTLYHLFAKVVGVCAMSHPIADYDQKRLQDKASNKAKFPCREHYILRED